MVNIDALRDVIDVSKAAAGEAENVKEGFNWGQSVVTTIYDKIGKNIHRRHDDRHDSCTYCNERGELNSMIFPHSVVHPEGEYIPED